MGVGFFGKIFSKGSKVSPTIKSVKPTTDISGSVKRVKSKEYTKRIDATNKAKSKIDTGRKMMREGQKELKRQVDTGKAFKFKYGTTREKTFPIEPGRNPKKEHGDLVEESKPQKKFKKGKELAREKKMGGGMMGRRMGYSVGLSVRPAVKKIKKLMDESKAKKQDAARVKKMGGGMMGRRMGYSQGSNGKPISRSKNPGILAMSKTAKGRKVVKERFKFNPDRIVAKKGGKA